MGESIKKIGSDPSDDFPTLHAYITYLGTLPNFGGNHQVAEINGVVTAVTSNLIVQTTKTTASEHIKIRSHLNQHEGKWDATKDTVVHSAGWIVNRDDYFDMEDVQESAGTTLVHVPQGNAGETIYHNVIIRGAYLYGIQLAPTGSGKKHYINNCTIIQTGVSTTYGIYHANVNCNTSNTLTHCNTLISKNAVSGSKGIADYAFGGGCTAYGNIAQNYQNGDFSLALGSVKNYNVSKDTTGQIQATLTFADAANDDFHLAETDTAAMEVCADLGTTARVNEDCDGEVKPSGGGLPWASGADMPAGDTTPPTGAAILSPADQATGVSVNPTITLAEGTENETLPIERYVELSLYSDFSVVAKNSGWISGTSWNPSKLSYLTGYYGRTKYRDSADPPNVSDWSATIFFTTETSPTFYEQPELYWDNRLYDSGVSIAATSQAASFPITNLIDNEKFPLWKASIATATQININFSFAIEADTLIVGGQNLVSFALLNSSDRFVSDSNLVTAHSGPEDFDILKRFDSDSSSSWRLSIANQSEVPEIGELFLGPRLVIDRPPQSYDPTEETVSVDIVEAENGIEKRHENFHLRRVVLPLKSIGGTLASGLNELRATARNTLNFWFCPTPLLNPIDYFGVLFCFWKNKDKKMNKTPINNDISIELEEVE